MGYEISHKRRDYFGEVEELKESFCDDIKDAIYDSGRKIGEYDGVYIPNSYGYTYDAIIINQGELEFLILDIMGDIDQRDSIDRLSILEITDIASNIEDIVAENDDVSFIKKDDVDDYSEEGGMF